MPNYGSLQPGPRYNGRVPLDSIRCCLFDVDNTLVGNESGDMPSDRFLAAADTAADEGIQIGLCTARPWPKVAHIVNAGIHGLSILSNGAQIYDGRSGEMIVELTISPEVACDIARMLQERGVDHWIQDDGRDHFWLGDKGGINSLGGYARVKNIWQPPVVDNREALDTYFPTKPFMVVAHNIDSALLPSLRSLALSYKDQEVKSLIAHEFNHPGGKLTYDVFFLNQRASKEAAIQTVADVLGISIEQMMAVGDGPNDTVVLERVGVGIAMGNAVTQTKSVASFIAPDIAHDGATDALQLLVRARSES